MSDNPLADQIVGVLERAEFEIRALRRRLEIAEAKVQAFELAGALLHSQPGIRTQGEQIDVAWEINKLLVDINQTLAAEEGHNPPRHNPPRRAASMKSPDPHPRDLE